MTLQNHCGSGAWLSSGGPAVHADAPGAVAELHDALEMLVDESRDLPDEVWERLGALSRAAPEAAVEALGTLPTRAAEELAFAMSYESADGARLVERALRATFQRHPTQEAADRRGSLLDSHRGVPSDAFAADLACATAAWAEYARAQIWLGRRGWLPLPAEQPEGDLFLATQHALVAALGRLPLAPRAAPLRHARAAMRIPNAACNESDAVAVLTEAIVHITTTDRDPRWRPVVLPWGFEPSAFCDDVRDWVDILPPGLEVDPDADVNGSRGTALHLEEPEVLFDPNSGEDAPGHLPYHARPDLRTIRVYYSVQISDHPLVSGGVMLQRIDGVFRVVGAPLTAIH